EALLRMAHPFMPFITEEIWQRIAPLAGQQGESIMLQPYPVADSSRIDAEAEADVQWIKDVITAVRNIRGEMRIAPGKELDIFLHNGGEDDHRRLQENRALLSKLARLASITLLGPTDSAPPSATQLVGRMELLVPMAGLIDKDAEIERLSREIEKLRKEVSRCDQKLKNPGFADKAPADVVAREQAKLD